MLNVDPSAAMRFVKGTGGSLGQQVASGQPVPAPTAVPTPQAPPKMPPPPQGLAAPVVHNKFNKLMQILHPLTHPLVPSQRKLLTRSTQSYQKMSMLYQQM